MQKGLTLILRFVKVVFDKNRKGEQNEKEGTKAEKV